MTTTRSTTEYMINVWLTFILFIIFIAVFTLYVRAEKKIDRANDRRHESLLMADELRQSSDDLTRMARSYVATGAPIYKQIYQMILDIRDGKVARPNNYQTAYWDLVLDKQQVPDLTNGNKIALLELMRNAQFSDNEMQLLSNSKTNSDKLAITELEAMDLVSGNGKKIKEKRDRALAILHGETYDHAKADIMRPINQFFIAMEKRTATSVHQAEHTALEFRLLLIGLGISLIFMLVRLKQILRKTLGGTVDEVYSEILRIGRGDFTVVSKMPNDSVLGWLNETQHKLSHMRHARIMAEQNQQTSDERYRTLFDTAQIGIVIFHGNPEAKFIEGNIFLCNMLGYNQDEFKELRPADVVINAEIEHIAPAINSIAANDDYSREWQFKRKDNSNFSAEVIATTMPDGTMMAMIRDITIRKKTEEALRMADERFRSTFKLIPHPLTLQTSDGTLIDCSDAFCEATGYNRGEVIGRNTEDLALWADANKRQEMQEILKRDGQVRDFEFLFRRRDGEIRTLQLSAKYITMESESVLLAVAHDITSRIIAEEALRKNERFIATLAYNIPGMVSHWTKNLRCDFANKEYLDWFGKTAEEVRNAKPQDIIGEKLYKLNEPLMLLALAGKPQGFEREIENVDGTKRYVWSQYIPDITDGQIEGVFILVMNISDRKNAELALHESALHTQAILDNMADGVVTINKTGFIESFNKAASIIFGYKPEEMIGQNVVRLIPDHTELLSKEYLLNNIAANANQFVGTSHELEGKRKNGSLFPMSLSVSKTIRGGKATYIGLVRDVSQQRKDEEEISRLAFYDPLTNLPNRRLLFDRLHQATLTSSRTDQHGALMFLDLDHFKQLNDSLGHDVGDILLQQVAQRLQTCIREGDSVARMGGDEFVMLIEALSIYPHEAAKQAEMVALKIISVLGEPYSLREHTYMISPSIGIVMFLNQSGSTDELLKKADVAMYQAKAAGRNNARFFDPSMQAAVSIRVELEKSMRRALTTKEFLLHYQLQVNHKGEPIGAEALVRWNHGEHGMISPRSFIPLAEETGIILPLGQWVLETACSQLVVWGRSKETQHWTLAVNVSVSQFAQMEFVINVRNALQKTGANPTLLKLEITESMLMKDIDEVVIKMVELKQMGVNFSLDDFGTGYSSLSYLKRLPLDQLKIDQSFVRDLLTDNNDAAIARTIVALGHSLSLHVIAEGVETVEQRNALIEMGCDAFQGYYFARPVAIENLPITISKIPS